MPRDIDVDHESTALHGKRILFGVTGGIAAVEAIRVGRELRRHGATIHVIMTESASEVISPLALEWSTQSVVDVAWKGTMPQLQGFDGVLIAPATRNTISKHLAGILDSPLLMALSKARTNGTPMLFVPSMHDDLFDDPVTLESLELLAKEGASHLFTESEEGRRKQPSSKTIVARLCNIVNSRQAERKRIIVTLGGNRAPIDDVRDLRNYSTGGTGWRVADYLHRSGHVVTCIVGTVDSEPVHGDLDLVHAKTHSEMGAAIQSYSSEEIDAWILAAAVLDYYPELKEGKMASGEKELMIRLLPNEKLIDDISASSPKSIRIGFKLEVGISDEELVRRAREQLDRTGNLAVVANHLRGVQGEGSRAILVSNDVFTHLDDMVAVCEAIEGLIVATH